MNLIIIGISIVQKGIGIWWRYKFEIIMRNCKEGIIKFLPMIMKIIVSLSDNKHDPEVRMDNLILIEFM